MGLSQGSEMALIWVMRLVALNPKDYDREVTLQKVPGRRHKERLVYLSGSATGTLGDWLASEVCQWHKPDPAACRFDKLMAEIQKTKAALRGGKRGQTRKLADYPNRPLLGRLNCNGMRSSPFLARTS